MTESNQNSCCSDGTDKVQNILNVLDIRILINEPLCTGCGLCAEKCSANAIFGKAKIPHFIDQNLCIKCYACYEVCEYDAIKFY